MTLSMRISDYVSDESPVSSAGTNRPERSDSAVLPTGPGWDESEEFDGRGATNVEETYRSWPVPYSGAWAGRYNKPTREVELETTTDLKTQFAHFVTEGDGLAPSETQYRITPAQKSYIALRVRGFSCAAAARKIGVHPNSVARWEHAAWFEPELEKARIEWLQEEGVDSRKEALSPVAGEAIQRMVGLIKSEDEKVALAAATEVLRMFWAEGKAPVGRPKKEKDSATPVLVNLDELRKQAQERINNNMTSIRDSNVASPDIRANG